MKVVDVTMSDDGLRAWVTLRPSWLRRLFGAPTVVAELVKEPRATHEREVWKSATTRRSLPDLDWGHTIRCALEARPVVAAKLPFARAQEIRR